VEDKDIDCVKSLSEVLPHPPHNVFFT